MQAAVLMPHVGAAHTELGNLGLGHGSVGASTGRRRSPVHRRNRVRVSTSRWRGEATNWPKTMKRKGVSGPARLFPACTQEGLRGNVVGTLGPASLSCPPPMAAEESQKVAGEKAGPAALAVSRQRPKVDLSFELRDRCLRSPQV